MNRIARVDTYVVSTELREDKVDLQLSLCVSLSDFEYPRESPGSWSSFPLG